MAYTLGDRTIDKVGVIGSGQIGPDIALHFTKMLAPFGVPVVVVDVSDEALTAGRERTERKIGKGVSTGAFSSDQAQAMLDNLTFTSDYDQLSGAGLVIEAATEDEKIKRMIVGQLERVCGDDTILASNSSHMEPEVIFADAGRPGRGLVVHYFFPAERNIVVEVVLGKDTDPAVADWLLGFYEAIGKAPIRVGSRYGYAVDPIFEGLFQAAALGVEAGWGTVKQVDAMTRRALGLGGWSVHCDEPRRRQSHHRPRTRQPPRQERCLVPITGAPRRAGRESANPGTSPHAVSASSTPTNSSRGSEMP